MDPILQTAATIFLRSALEAMVMQKTLALEGRTKMTPEEEAKLKQLTDIEGAIAREIGNKL